MSQDRNELLSELNRKVSVQPADAEVRTERAYCLASLGRFEEALDDFTGAVKLAPEEHQIRYRRLRAEFCFGLSKYRKKSIPDFEYIVENRPDDLTACVGLAVAQIFAGDLSKGEGRLGGLVAKNGQPAVVQYERRVSSVFAPGGIPPKGIRASFDRVQRNPNGRAYSERAEALSGMGKYRFALADAVIAVGLSPRDADAYRVRARIHDWLDAWKSSVHDWTQVLELESGDVEALTSRAVAWIQLDDRDRALADLDLAAAKAPDDPNVFLQRGLLRINDASQVNAIEDFTKAILLSRKPGSEQRIDRLNSALLYRGDAYAREGTLKLALDDYNAILQSAQGVKRGPALRGRGDVQYLSGSLEDALRDFAELNELFPEQFHGSLGCAKVFMKKAMDDEAMVELSRVLSIRPNDYDALELRARIYRKRGDIRKADADEAAAKAARKPDEANP